MVILSASTAKISWDDEWNDLPNTFNEDLKMEQDTPTMTAKIFELSAPYTNPYQGNRKRLLFVCSAGLLRSPTGAAVATELGYNARSCGSSEYALIPLSVNLIMWADKIIFVNRKNYLQALETFTNTGYETYIEEKADIMDIPDIYEAYHPMLLKIFKDALEHYK